MAYAASTPSSSLSRPPQQVPPTSPVPDTGTIRCLCGFTDDDGETIFCEECGYWQHMSCVGLANMPKEELPDMWYCWHCRPEKFEWIQNNGSAPGETLAVSLGISPTHWNVNYAHGLGLQLDMSGRPIAGSGLATASSRSSALSISNLLSPAPFSIPPAPQPKILLDAAKARKRQEQRKVEEERLKRHQKEAAAATAGTSASGSGSGSNPNGTNNTARTPVEPAATSAAAHGRKPSVAAGDKPAKGRKQPVPVATAGGAVAGPSTFGASTSTPGAAASSSAGPSTAIPPAASTAATVAAASKRKPSNAPGGLKRNKEKEPPTKVAIPESSPQFSHGAQPFPTPLPTSTPRAGSFLPPKSPGRGHQIVGAPGQSRSRSRSLSIDAELRMVIDGEVGPNGPYLDVEQSGEIEDYFTGVGKGKGKEKEGFAVPVSARDGLSTPLAVSTPFLPNGPPSAVIHTPRSAHPSYRSPPPPLPQPRPLHPLITSLGAGAKLGAPKGASTGSSLSRPRPLVIRSFPAPPRTSGDEDESIPRHGLSLFLDPQPPPQPSSTRMPTSMLPPPTTPKSTILSTAASLLPPDTDSLAIPSVRPNSLSPQPNPPLSISIPDYAATFSSFFPVSTAARTERRAPKPPVGATRPNAVVRPLICGEHGHLATGNNGQPQSTRSSGVTFGVFALRDTVAGEPISLGWEMLETLNESSHIPSSPIATLSYIADTFITCGSCGRKASDCVPDVLRKVEELSAKRREEEELQRSEIEVDVVSTSPGDGFKVSGHGKRARSVTQTPTVDAMVVDGAEGLDRPAKRQRLVSNTDAVPAVPEDIQDSATAPKPADASPEPESLLGIDSTLRQLQLEPGTPALPDPRARFRASWKLQMEKIQATQAAMVDNVQLAAAQAQQLPVPSVPAPPASSSVKRTMPASKLLVPVRSISSSPLTEQSETGDEESDALSPTGPPPSRSPQRLVNGRGSRVNKVRIESTPPSGDEFGAELSSSKADAVVPPVRMLDLSQVANQKGPLRFRKWAVKLSEPPPPPVDVRMETPAPQLSSPVSQRTPVPAAPVLPSVDNDGDVDMGDASNPQPLPTPKAPSPPPPPPAPSTASFSIRNLLNPAPDKPRSKVQVDILPVTPAKTENAPQPPSKSHESTETLPAPVPTPLPIIANQAVPTFRTSSPTLNLLLSGPKPVEQQAKPSPLVAVVSHSVDVTEADEPSPPSPKGTQETSVADSSTTEERQSSLPMSYQQKVEEVETSLSKLDESVAPSERHSSEMREPSPVSQVPELDMLVADPTDHETEEDSVMMPAEDASVGIQSPLPPIPEAREEISLRPSLHGVIPLDLSMDVDPPSSSPLSEAPPELPIISVTSDAPAPSPPKELKEIEAEPSPVPEPAPPIQTETASPEPPAMTTQDQPKSSPPAPEPVPLDQGLQPPESLQVSTGDDLPAQPEATLSPAIPAPVSPAPSSAAAMSPKPATPATRKKMSFAEYAKMRRTAGVKAKKQQETPKEPEKGPAEASGSRGLDLVLESNETSVSKGVIPNPPAEAQGSDEPEPQRDVPSPAIPSPRSLEESTAPINSHPGRGTSTPPPAEKTAEHRSTHSTPSDKHPAASETVGLSEPAPSLPIQPSNPAPDKPETAEQAKPLPVELDKSMDVDEEPVPRAPSPSVSHEAHQPASPPAKIVDQEGTLRQEALESASGNENTLPTLEPKVTSIDISPSRQEAASEPTPPAERSAPNGVTSPRRDSTPKPQVNGVTSPRSPSPASPSVMSARRDSEATPARTRHRPMVVESPTVSRESSQPAPEVPSTPPPVPMTPPRAPASVTVIDPEEAEKEDQDEDTQSHDGGHSEHGSEQSPSSEKKSGKPKIPEIAPPMQLNTDFGALAAKLAMAVAEDDKEKDRYHAPTPPPQPIKKPPTGPRRATAIVPPASLPQLPANPVQAAVSATAPPAEEGEIPSSPGHASTPLALRIARPISNRGLPTGPRSHYPGRASTPPRGSSPPGPSSRPTLLSRMPPSEPRRGPEGLPTGPRASLHRGPPPGPARYGGPRPSWDDRDRDSDRDRDWDRDRDLRDRDRDRIRDDRDRDRDRDRERERDRDRRRDWDARWRGAPRGRGGRGR